MTHGEVGVEAFQCLSVEVSVTSFADLAVKCRSSIAAEIIALLTDRLGEPLTKEREYHPHVNVIGVTHTAWSAGLLTLDDDGVMAQDADLDGLLYESELLMLALAELEDLRFEPITICLSQEVPLTD